MIKSVTAVKKGWGSMPHRSVSFLTAEEKEAIRKGELVYFEISKTHYRQSGFKVVTQYQGKFDSREPSGEELKMIIAEGGK